jgi:hypothetical protein
MFLLLNIRNAICVLYYSTFQSELNTFQVFSSHTWLIVTIVDGTGLKHKSEHKTPSLNYPIKIKVRLLL